MNRAGVPLRVFVVIVLIGGSFAWIVPLYEAVVGVQRDLCPAGTFLAGPNHLASIIMPLSWFFASIPLVLLVAILVEAVVRLATGRFEGSSFLSEMWQLLQIMLVLSLPMLLLSLAEFPSRYCVSPSGVAEGHFLGLHTSQYRWGDVSAVDAHCWRDRSSSEASYELVMNDGTRVDLMFDQDAFIAAWTSIASTL